MPLGPWKINVGSPPNTHSTVLRGLFVRIYGNDKAIRFFRTDSLRYGGELKYHNGLPKLPSINDAMNEYTKLTLELF